MKALYVSNGDVFSRHELGFLAALTEVMRVDVLDLRSQEKPKVLTIVSDNGFREARFIGYKTSFRSLLRINGAIHRLGKFIDDAYDIIFATPRFPIMFLWRISVEKPIILRLWSIRAAKLRDNLRFGAYEDILLFIPSLLANGFYILSSSYSTAVDHATYVFAKRMYGFLRSRIAKLYPPYGYLGGSHGSEIDEHVLNILDRAGEDYVLGFTSLHKRGSYLKFEAKPHAVVLYLIARKLRNTNVVIAGSTREDWRSVFAKEPSQNMYFIGRGFSDKVLPRLYGNARLVIIPITNRNISNRLLEALFYGRPIITSEIVRLVHPELVHGKHVYVSNWYDIVDDVTKLVKSDEALKKLEEGAKRAYKTWFSTKLNMVFTRKLVERLMNQ